MMVRALTGCERIPSDAVPSRLRRVLRAVVIIWLALLPSALRRSSTGRQSRCRRRSPLVLAVEELAVQIENLFGLDANDLPLESFCLTVQADAPASSTRRATPPRARRRAASRPGRCRSAPRNKIKLLCLEFADLLRRIPERLQVAVQLALRALGSLAARDRFLHTRRPADEHLHLRVERRRRQLRLEQILADVAGAARPAVGRCVEGS